MKSVDWNHDLAARHARCLRYLGRDKAGGLRREVTRLATVAVCIVAGLLILWCV